MATSPRTKNKRREKNPSHQSSSATEHNRPIGFQKRRVKRVALCVIQLPNVMQRVVNQHRCVVIDEQCPAGTNERTNKRSPKMNQMISLRLFTTCIGLQPKIRRRGHFKALKNCLCICVPAEATSSGLCRSYGARESSSVFGSTKMLRLRRCRHVNDPSSVE
jgi:hypothetical protein